MGNGQDDKIGSLRWALRSHHLMLKKTIDGNDGRWEGENVKHLI